MSSSLKYVKVGRGTKPENRIESNCLIFMKIFENCLKRKSSLQSLVTQQMLYQIPMFLFERRILFIIIFHFLFNYESRT